MRKTLPRRAARGELGRLIAALPAWECAVGWTADCMPFTNGVLGRYRRAGFGHLSLTVAAEGDTIETTMRHLARVRSWFAARSGDCMLVDRVGDVGRASRLGRLAISFNFQGGSPFGGDLGLVEVYSRLGVKRAILSYNGRNALGTGCLAPQDRGLTRLGRRFVAALNRAGMTIDISHVGERTALDTVAASRHPVIASHSNARSVHDHARNLSDRLIKACARRGGVIGINGLGFMLGPDNRASAKLFAAHADRVVALVGPKHVGLGMDWNFYDPFMRRMFDATPAMAALGYPRPPWPSLAPEALPAILAELKRLGWRDRDLRGLLGGNLKRIAGTVWH
jgi:membrane dipeptidase